MAALNWPGFGIKSINWTLNQPSQSNKSLWTGKRTVVADPWHSQWSARVDLAPIVGESKMLPVRSFLARMKGTITTFHLPAAEHAQNANSGVTVGSTAAAGATTMTISGAATPMLDGQYVTVNGQLLMMTANQSGSTITFLPMLRVAAVGGTAVETSKPYVLVHMVNANQGWSVAPGQLHNVSFDVEEAIGEADGTAASGDLWS